MKLDPNNPLHLISGALATNPEAVVTLPVFAPHDPDSTLVLRARKRVQRISPELAAKIQAEEVARHAHTHQGNGSTPPDLTLPTHIELGRLLLNVPADVADNLRGPVLERHPIYLIMVHRGFYDQAIRQADSGLIIPGSGPAPASVVGSRIIKP